MGSTSRLYTRISLSLDGRVCQRQGITYYLRYNGYSVKEIALWQRKNLNVIYSQISTFERLLSVKDKLAVEVLNKIREVDG